MFLAAILVLDEFASAMNIYQESDGPVSLSDRCTLRIKAIHMIGLDSASVALSVK